MARETIGKQPARYTFLLNPYLHERVSKCPKCQHLTYSRKFALFIHAEGYGPIVLGKTCRYCTKCEMIIGHKNELDAEMEIAMSKVAPEAVGRGYLVLGTMDRKVWQRNIQGEVSELGDTLEHVSEIKKHLVLEVKRGGWGPAEK